MVGRISLHHLSSPGKAEAPSTQLPSLNTAIHSFSQFAASRNVTPTNFGDLLCIHYKIVGASILCTLRISHAWSQVLLMKLPFWKDAREGNTSKGRKLEGAEVGSQHSQINPSFIKFLEGESAAE